MGCAAAIMTLKTKSDKPKSAEPKSEVKIDINESLDDFLGYELRPKRTQHSKKTILQRKEKNKKRVYFIGFISTAVIATSFILMNLYFQLGRDTDSYNEIWNVLWLVFGKIIFTIALFAFLINVCVIFDKFPKAIANNYMIQLIGNLSFCIYGWHYNLLHLSIGANQTYQAYSDYMYMGAFFWVFVSAFFVGAWFS